MLNMLTEISEQSRVASEVKIFRWIQELPMRQKVVREADT